MDEQRARSIIADHLHVPLDRVRDSADFVHLGADSLDLVSLTMRFEEEFDIHVTEEAAERCTTIGDALSLLRICRQPA